MKATFKESYSTRHGKFQLRCLIYEYRGTTYEVFLGDTQDTLAEQHKMQQAIIDRQKEIEERAKENKRVSTAQEGFDFFWQCVNAE